MRRPSLGIGAKFIVSGAIGVALVAGMLLNEHFSYNSAARLHAASDIQKTIAAEVAGAQVQFSNMRISRRLLLIASDQKAIDSTMNDVKAASAEGHRLLDQAIEKSELPEHKQHLARLQALMIEFADLTGSDEASQKRLLALRRRQPETASAWTRLSTALTASAAFTEAPNRHDMEIELSRAATAFADARAAFWKYAMVSEPELLAEVHRAAQQGVAALKHLRSMGAGKDFTDRIDELAAVLGRLDADTSETEQVMNEIDARQRDHLSQLRQESDAATEQAIALTRKLADEKSAQLDADFARSGWTGLGIGIVVMVILGLTAFISGRGEHKRKLGMRALADTFEQAIGQVVSTVTSASTELEAAAQTLTHTAEGTQQLSTTVASASEQASTNIQSVASASEELAASVAEIARQVQESSRIANEAVRQATGTDTRISELSMAAARIGDVVKLITAIAEQTNLLALNATIEAARAGDAGRGFAVVASEVKSLANQTAKATDDIVAQISGMQAATGESVSAIKEIGTTIGRIAEIASAIATAIEKQGASTRDISASVQQAARGATEVADNIGDVARGATETGTASSQVLSSARDLANDGNRLKLEVQKFLATVRAA